MNQPRSAPWGHLEDESRRTILGFIFKTVMVLPLVALGQHPMAATQTIALIYGLWCTAFAILFRQRAYGSNLNYWDEALWFFATSLAAGLCIEPDAAAAPGAVS
jgi:hypothetical protein